MHRVFTLWSMWSFYFMEEKLASGGGGRFSGGHWRARQGDVGSQWRGGLMALTGDLEA